MKMTKSFQDWCLEHNAKELLDCYEAGQKLPPANQVGFSSTLKANFLCTKCGYQWQRTLNKATRENAKLDCPACNGRVSWGDNIWTKQYPELLLQWDYENNIEEPENCGSKNKKFYWYCKKCRNRWKACLKDRIRAADHIREKCGELCPFCKKKKISPQHNLAECYCKAASRMAKNGT